MGEVRGYTGSSRGNQFRVAGDTIRLAGNERRTQRRVEGRVTYDEYIAQQQQAIDEEQQDDSCFIADVPECQFVRGH